MSPDKPGLRDVLSYYGTELGREKREVSVRCPVHEEDRPSCSVNEITGLWSCHACGAGGDSLTLIQLKEGLTDDFRAALQFAAEHFGTSGPDVSGGTGRTNSGIPERPRFARGVFKPAFRKRSRA